MHGLCSHRCASEDTANSAHGAPPPRGCIIGSSNQARFSARQPQGRSLVNNRMKRKSISARSLGNWLALVMMLLGASFGGPARGHEQDSASVLELTKQMQREAAAAELQVTLAGNLKDFSIATGEVSNQATQRAQQSQARAAAAYREALTNSPDDAELHFVLSLALAKLGDANGAPVELQSAIRLDPHMT